MAKQQEKQDKRNKSFESSSTEGANDGPQVQIQNGTSKHSDLPLKMGLFTLSLLQEFKVRIEGLTEAALNVEDRLLKTERRQDNLDQPQSRFSS